MRSPIDYTVRRLSKLHGIVVCPVCGRKGHRRQYRDGSAIIEHRIEYQPPFGNAVTTDHCMLTATLAPR